MSATGADPSALSVAADALGGLAEPDSALGARTTYRVGGPAALLVVARSAADLAAVAEARRRSGLPVVVVGRGSNLLVADRGFPGIAVVLDAAEDAFGWVRIDGSFVSAGAAVPLPTLARRSVDAGLTGFEWAVGVPGSVGGAVRMNAGGHGSDMARSVAGATVANLDAPALDGQAHVTRWGPGDLAYGYRRSAVAAHHVVLDVTLALSDGDRESGAETIRSIVRWRREHQPGGQNAGSVFTNPSAPSVPPAGRLVEEAGCKGRRLGTAAVSTKHANFIQADPGGSADDVDALIRAVAAAVHKRSGVSLRTELRRIGYEPQHELEGES
jgi:UDP-N-acetylmuramate dehydrogenase